MLPRVPEERAPSDAPGVPEDRAPLDAYISCYIPSDCMPGSAGVPGRGKVRGLLCSAGVPGRGKVRGLLCSAEVPGRGKVSGVLRSCYKAH